MTSDDRPLTPSDEALLAQLIPQLDDRPGPARRRPAAASEAAVQSIVAAALAQRAEEAEEAPAPERLGRAPRRRMLLMAAAAAIALVSLGAGAAVLVVKVYREAEQAREVERAKRQRPTVTAPLVAPPSVEPQVEAEPEPESAAPEASAEPAAAEPTRRHAVRHTKHRAVTKTSPSPAAAAWLDEVDLASAPLEDLLALANRLRRGHEWSSADEVYRTVIERFPGSDASVVAEIASATLKVEHLGAPADGLTGYQRALRARPTGPLAEEARWGEAEAFRALGDKDREAAALQDFLSHHSGSALSAEAKRRAAELGR